MACVDLTDARLYYEIRGAGEALLLIPGLGQPGHVWDPLVPALASKFSVIQIDNRGIGRSIEKRPVRGLDDYVSDCIELLDFLQVSRAHVVGMSFGGVLAQLLAADHPSRVDRLGLISTTDRSSPYLHHMALLLGMALRRFPMRLFFQTVELLGTSPEAFDAHEPEIMQSVAHRTANRALRHALQCQIRCLLNAESVNSCGRSVTAPTLVLAGEYDAMIPNCYGRRLAAALPDARFYVLEGCGHNPVQEKPLAVIEKLVGFLLENRADDLLEMRSRKNGASVASTGTQGNGNRLAAGPPTDV